MDPHNDKEFVDRKVADYWGQVDLYIGGTEHAVGHLLYSRLWTKVLYDLGYIGFDEPYKKLVNQGMIQGSFQVCLSTMPNLHCNRTTVEAIEIKILPTVCIQKVIGIRLLSGEINLKDLFNRVIRFFQEQSRVRRFIWRFNRIYD